MKKATSVLSFSLSHLVESAVSVLAPIVLLVIAFVLLFLVAVFTNPGLGSPIGLTLWTAFAAVLSAAYTAFRQRPIRVHRLRLHRLTPL